MYGLSDQSKPIPLTRFSALRHGSSRYSTAIGGVYRTCVRLAVEDLGRRPVESRGQPIGLERGRDLLHLADPAPALALGRALRGGEPLGQLRLRVPPFAREHVLDALGAREVADREQERDRKSTRLNSSHGSSSYA